ncbi:DUF2058 domain-containing protein [Patescibacteria group bacterium]|nr:DUF2058 domain-containing protein [Patescibacteria group bacterium]MBU1029132.1 DUF2058 domain-containing protein [Patescibacteria group bacterium]
MVDNADNADEMSEQVSWLKEAAGHAINAGREACQAERDRQEQELERQRQEDMEAAKRIVAQIPPLIRQRATAGYNFAVVLQLKSTVDYTPRPTGALRRYDVCEISQLKGVAAIVFDQCDLAALRPTIEYWHDGCGRDSGFDIVVYWD